MQIAIAQLFNKKFYKILKPCITQAAAYCKRHGYDHISVCGSVAKDCAPTYQKSLFLLREIEKYDYIMWLDADTIIANQSIKLEDIINKYTRDIYYCAQADSIDYAYDALNAGVLIFKNSDYSKRVLQEWWELRDTEQFMGDQPKLIEALRRMGPLDPTGPMGHGPYMGPHFQIVNIFRL